jgi:baculoviral IAP repeat-containing protein 6
MDGQSGSGSGGQINVAPLGTISSTNFSAHPSEVLLQSAPPHRRARTPVWSYHFFPEESYLELVISLPCAVLLKEVHIVPHMTSLSTCPSAIMIEVSRGGVRGGDIGNGSTPSTLPMGPPVNTSGMSNITIQLVQPTVAKTILLRLFKPKDSSNLGLSQIRLMGSTTFSEAALQGIYLIIIDIFIYFKHLTFPGLSAHDVVKSFESSAHWLYILDRAIQVSEQQEQSQNSLSRRIIETAVNIPDVLESCYSMLIAPVSNGKAAQDLYLPHVASVLFQFGSLRYDVSQQLMEALLGPVQMGFTHGMVVNTTTNNNNYLGMGGGNNINVGHSQLNTVVELLYKLCVDIPTWGLNNLMAMMSWLESCADADNSSSSVSVNCSIAAPSYFQAISASIWTLTSLGKVDLSEICTPKLLW